jgi:hypothetical protein
MRASTSFPSFSTSSGGSSCKWERRGQVISQIALLPKPIAKIFSAIDAIVR